MAASRETLVPKSILVLNQTKQDVTRCGQRLAGIQSPAQKHEDVKAGSSRMLGVRFTVKFIDSEDGSVN
jgi:hypothetical protein